MINQPATAQPTRQLTIADLAQGQEAEVRGMAAYGSTAQRLLCLGLLPGCRLRYLRRAPLGDPLMIELGGCLVCLRRAEAKLVEVEICPQ